jgi:class 3 adenylate cyclase
MADHLGLEPSPALVALEQAIVRHDPELAGTSTAPDAPVPSTLPSGVVTFLLTDVVGSTRLWERNPTSMARALERHDAMIAAAVAGQCGHLVKPRGEGDATFSVFDRATDAALAAVTAQAALAAEDWPPDTTIEVRMAIHTGEAFERDGDYFGPAVNRVARLRGVGKGRQILVSQAAAEIIADHLPDGTGLVRIGEQRLRDLARPETVYHLVADADGTRTTGSDQDAGAPPKASEVPLPSWLAELGSFPFTGRVDEHEILTNAAATTGAGGRGLVLIVGEPGIGKTRLAAHAAQRLAEHGALVLGGRADELVGAPYQPFVQAFQTWLAAPGAAESLGAEAGELARLVPTLTTLVPVLGPPLAADAESERLRLFDAVRTWLLGLSCGGLVVLVLDDLQWADHATLLLLRHVVATDPVPGLLVVATCRDTELDPEHPLATMLGELHRRADLVRIDLDGLRPDEVVELVARAAGHDLDHDGVALARSVHQQTGGNPFFVGEILRHLTESGAITRVEGQWVATPADEGLPLPAGVREVVRRRVETLAPGVQRALTAAAVVGTEFTLDVLQSLVEEPEDELIDLLDEAVAAHLVVEAGIDRYRFVHSLVGMTLQGTLSASRRTRMHRAIAVALEAANADTLDDVVIDLAHHWAEAGPAAAREHGVGYATRAARLALARAAPEDAAGWYRRARKMLAAAGPADPGLDAQLTCRLGQAMALAGLDGWREVLIEAAQAAEVLGDLGLMADALFDHASTAMSAGVGARTDPEKIALLERALDRCGPERGPTWASLTVELLHQLIQTGDDERRVELFQSLAAYWRTAEDPEASVPPFTAGLRMPWSLRSPELFALFRASAARAVERGASRGDHRLTAEAHYSRFFWSFCEGLPTFRDALREVETFVERHPHPLLSDVLVTDRMAIAVMEGRPAQAEELAQEVEQRWTRRGRHEEGQVLASNGRLQAARETVGFAALVDLFEVMPRLAPGRPDIFESLLALSLAQAGRTDDARAKLTAWGANGFRDIPDDATLPVVETAWSEAAAIARHRPAATVFYDRMLRYVDIHQAAGRVYAGSTSRLLGLLADALERDDEIDHWFERAAQDHVTIGSPTWLATGLLDWAESRARRGDADQARALAARGLDTISGLELTVSRSRAERLLATAG